MEKNHIFATTTLSEYLKQYASAVHCGLLALDEKALHSAYSRIKETANSGGTLYVTGNGGSAALSEHLMCDFMKCSGIKVRSLCSSVSLLTAIANDIDYEEIFSKKLLMVGACSRDLLMLISCSGNSPNVIKAAEYAATVSMPVIGLTGFSGGKLRMMCDVSLHINAHNYGVIEDAHQAIMHSLAQWATVS